MKLFSVVVPFVLLSSVMFGQTTSLPDILKPTLADESEAQSLGVEVFKILPRGMFQGPFNAYKDEENPLGIREGGAYYSFTTRSHSYNKTPQIGYESGELQTGFAGLQYGLILDLGKEPLIKVSVETNGVRFLANYQTPKLVADIRKEQAKRGNYEADGLVYTSHLPAIAGHSYVLRAINPGIVDKLVVLNILRKNDDGSLIILWNPLKDFETSWPLHQTDDELSRKIAAMLNDAKFANVHYEVNENVVILTGSVGRRYHAELIRKVQETMPVKIDNRVSMQ
jgi:hypothetical protein